MAVKTFTTGEVLTASDTNTYLNNGGLVYITGATFSGSGTVNVNNVFTSTYDNYRLIFSTLATSATSVSVNMRMRASGSDYTGSEHKWALYGIISNGTLSNNTGGSNTSLYLFDSGTTNAQTMVILDVINPQKANTTLVKHDTMFEYTSFNWYWRGGGQAVNTTTQFDGFTVYASSGNISGTYRLYGYRQA